DRLARIALHRGLPERARWWLDRAAEIRRTIEEQAFDAKRGSFMDSFGGTDEFGIPTTAFNICTFWYIDALARIGRAEEARELFEGMLASRNHVGLLSEDTGLEDGQHWGNYPQTYSLVGIINVAMRLARGWEDFT